MEYNKEMEKAEIERDVFIEFGDQVCANFAKYFNENGIAFEDAENPAVKKCKEALNLVRKANKFKSVEEVKDAYRQLDEIRRFYRELQ